MKLNRFQFQKLTGKFSFEIERLLARPPYYGFKYLSNLDKKPKLLSNQIAVLEIVKSEKVTPHYIVPTSLFSYDPKRSSNLKKYTTKLDEFELDYYILQNHILIFDNFRVLCIPPKLKSSIKIGV